MRTTTILATATAVAAAGTAAAVQLAAPAVAESPRTPALVFTSDRDGDHEIYAVSALGRTTQLTRNTSADYGAVWSPDGRRLAFVSDRDGDPDIYVMAADGSGVRQLTRNGTAPDGRPVVDREPAWSPDGTRIAFTSDRDGGEAEIYVMNADGSGAQRLTRTQDWVMNHGPDWSPDGREIAFSSARESYENAEIYRMLADGTQVRRVTRTADGIDDTTPAWSPNGKEIAFTSNRSRTQGVYVMRPDGSAVRQVTDDPSLDDVFPRWTKNGRQLVFWTFAGPEGTPSEDIWMVRSDGTGRQRLVATAAGESAPDPRPVGRRR